ncbi:MAG: flagellar hook-length control protein FliK [Silicimonas sp.]|nr:flagellar hook-length control protein FliK [Silicimonas sp.]
MQNFLQIISAETSSEKSINFVTNLINDKTEVDTNASFSLDSIEDTSITSIEIKSENISGKNLRHMGLRELQIVSELDVMLPVKDFDSQNIGDSSITQKELPSFLNQSILVIKEQSNSVVSEQSGLGPSSRFSEKTLRADGWKAESSWPNELMQRKVPKEIKSNAGFGSKIPAGEERRVADPVNSKAVITVVEDSQSVGRVRNDVNTAKLLPSFSQAGPSQIKKIAQKPVSAQGEQSGRSDLSPTTSAPEVKQVLAPAKLSLPDVAQEFATASQLAAKKNGPQELFLNDETIGNRSPVEPPQRALYNEKIKLPLERQQTSVTVVYQSKPTTTLENKPFKSPGVRIAADRVSSGEIGIVSLQSMGRAQQQVFTQKSREIEARPGLEPVTKVIQTNKAGGNGTFSTVSTHQPAGVSFPFATHLNGYDKEAILESAHYKGDGIIHMPTGDGTDVNIERPMTKTEITVRPVMQQLAQAARQAGDGSVEVRLSPEELGRVRLALTPGEASIVVHISVERPETLELVRRNIELFTQSLLEEGFSDVSFSFGQPGSDSEAENTNDQTQGPNNDKSKTDNLASGQPVRTKQLPIGQLDIRL